MQALISTCWAADWPAVNMHPGDVDWWTVHAHGKPQSLSELVRLWFTSSGESDLVGFAWYGQPAEADIVVHPGYREGRIVAEMTGWFEGRVKDFGGLDGPARARIWTIESEAPTVAALSEAGYRPTDESGYARYCGELAEIDLRVPALPEGFTYGTIETEAQIDARVVASRAAFPGSSMSGEKYRLCQTTPLYRQELDSIVLTAGGRIAAYALGWLHPGTASVELEPVGVHPEFWRRGFGRAVCRRTLRAAWDLGARQAMIGAETTNPASNALYASLGLRPSARVAAFGRRA